MSGSARSGRLILAGSLLGIVLIWGWVLPAIGSREAVRASVQRMERQRINPGAIFYTDISTTPTRGSATNFLEKGID